MKISVSGKKNHMLKFKIQRGQNVLFNQPNDPEGRLQVRLGVDPGLRLVVKSVRGHIPPSACAAIMSLGATATNDLDRGEYRGTGLEVMGGAGGYPWGYG